MLTKKQIKEIAKQTPAVLKDKSISNFYQVGELGYYMPSNANWSYKAVFIKYDNVVILVATRFGHIIKED